MNTTLIYAITTFLGSTIGVSFLLPRFIAYSREKKLIDAPNERASHSIPTPTSGGITFIVSILITVLTLSLSFESLIICALLCMIGVMGFVDDRLDLNALLKLGIEAVVVGVLFYLGISTKPLEVICGLPDLPVAATFFLTFMAIAGLINAFNLIDGIDGLAGGISLINTLSFAYIFWTCGNDGFTLIHLALSGALIVFLFYNFNPAKIFMGDAGSLIIGLLMGISFLRVLEYENDTMTTWAFSMMLFPCIDMLRLFISRIRNMKSPFSADRNHYHHLLLKTGNNHRQAAIACYIIHTLIILSGLLLLKYLTLIQTNLIVLNSSVIVYMLIEWRYLKIHQKQRKAVDHYLKRTLDNNRLLKRIAGSEINGNNLLFYSPDETVEFPAKSINFYLATLNSFRDLKEQIVHRQPDILVCYAGAHNTEEILQIIRFLQMNQFPVPVIVLSDTGDKTNAINFIREGAVDYIDSRDPETGQLLNGSINEILEYRSQLQVKGKHSLKTLAHAKAIFYILLFVGISVMAIYFLLKL